MLVLISYFHLVSVKVFLSTIDIRGQLLPLHGISPRAFKFFHFLHKFSHGHENSNVYFLMQQICHRDLKLENTLLDGSSAPRLKICDFGYSKVMN